MNISKKRVQYRLVKATEVDQYVAKGFELQNEMIYWIPELTKREKECLRYVFQEKKQKQIAIEMFCSERQIRRFVKALREKFQVKRSNGLLKFWNLDIDKL